MPVTKTTLMMCHADFLKEMVMKKMLFVVESLAISLPVIGCEDRYLEPYIQFRPQLQFFIQASQKEEAELSSESRTKEKIEEIRILAERLASRLEAFVGELEETKDKPIESFEENDVEGLSHKLMSVLYDDDDDIAGEGQIPTLRKFLSKLLDMWDQAIQEQDRDKQQMIRHKVAHFFANCDDYPEINTQLEDLADRADKLDKGER